MEKNSSFKSFRYLNSNKKHHKKIEKWPAVLTNNFNQTKHELINGLRNILKKFYLRIICKIEIFFIVKSKSKKKCTSPKLGY